MQTGSLFERINWTPGIGDPTVLGWVAVFGYFWAAFLAMLVARSVRSYDPLRMRAESPLFWSMMAWILIFLGFNKQLDLQTLFTDIAREIAKEDGWYEGRREVQMYFMMGIAGASGLFLLFLTFLIRAGFWRCFPALLGLLFLCTFVLFRALSFHHFEYLLRQEVKGTFINNLLEMGGIGLFAMSCKSNLLWLRKQKGRRRRRAS